VPRVVSQTKLPAKRERAADSPRGPLRKTSDAGEALSEVMKAIAGPSEFQAKGQLKRIQKKKIIAAALRVPSIEKRIGTLCSNEQRFAPLPLQ